MPGLIIHIKPGTSGLPVTHGDTDYLSWLNASLADPATLLHFRFAGLFDAPGRSQFVPADQAFSF